MLQGLARNWWMLVIRGAVAVLLGIVVFVSPNIALATLVALWGAYALVNGITIVMVGLQGRQTNSMWWVTAIQGLISIGVGVVSFFWPGITALSLLYLIAAWAVITGIMEISAAIQLRKEITGEFWLGLSGLASLIFGIVLIVSPTSTGILSVLWILGFYAIMFGLSLIMLGFRLRKQTGTGSSPRISQTA